MVKLRLSFSLLSATVIEKWKAPTVVGVPDIAPLEVMDSPVGSDPEVTEKVYGGEPSRAVTVPEYGVPRIPVSGIEFSTIILAARVKVIS